MINTTTTNIITGNTSNNPLAHYHNPLADVDDPAVVQGYQDALEEVHTRFLLNLPPEELATADRILFQIEQAWWFYEDWICDQQTSLQLPRFKHLKPFAVEMFQFSPLLDVHQFHAMWASFSEYKRKISTYGCILINSDCTKVLLCQDYNSKSWTFPAGKINQGEEGVDAAARETWEETGFDVNCKHGLTQQMHPDKVTWQPLQEKDAVAYTEESGKRRTYYICHGVPEDFPYGPVVRKEVASVQWHPLEKVPKKNFALIPILPKLRLWVKRNHTVNSSNNNKNSAPKKARDDKSNTKPGRDKSNQRLGSPKKQNPSDVTPLKSNKTPNRKGKEAATDQVTDTTTGKKTPNRKKQSSRPKSRGKTVQSHDPLLESGLAHVGAENRWSEEAMFQANEKLLGRKVEYDGNPHVFSDKGFQGMDPHQFHIVGGNFLNSDTADLAPPPPTSRLQHLFHADHHERNDGNRRTISTDEVLTPFFSDDGATPWGEVVPEVKESLASPERRPMPKDRYKPTNDGHVKSNPNKQNIKVKGKPTQSILAVADNDPDLVFLTDQEITERSQKIKLAEWKASQHGSNSESEKQYQQDMEYIQNWVDNLPKAPPTRHFGDFKFNVDALMEALYQHY